MTETATKIQDGEPIAETGFVAGQRIRSTQTGRFGNLTGNYRIDRAGVLMTVDFDGEFHLSTIDSTHAEAVIVCAGGCGRSTTDVDLWDPCVETGKRYCDGCWPDRTRRLDPIEFSISETDDGFEVHSRDGDGGLSRGWSLADRCSTAEDVGRVVAEEIAYRRKIER